jgi:hypothetical protein
VTAGMKILQIERVVRHLIDGAGIKVLGAHFKFDDEDNARADDNRVYALAHAWDREFQRNPPVAQFALLVLEKRDLLDPRIALEGIETMRMLGGEVAEDGLWLLPSKSLQAWRRNRLVSWDSRLIVAVAEKLFVGANQFLRASLIVRYVDNDPIVFRSEGLLLSSQRSPENR